jgi:hypothetical protein
VRDGVFRGTEGVVKEFRHKCKAIITLAAVQQCFSIEMTLDDLVVLDKPTPKAGFGLLPAFGH